MHNQRFRRTGSTDHYGNRRRSVESPCENCGAVMQVEPNQRERGEGRFCSYGCKAEGQRGARVLGTKYTDPRGYVMVKVGLRKYQAEHRIVAEQALGRHLAAGEQVHHVNGVKDDNRPENLQVLTNTEHQRLHDHLGVQHTPRTIELVCDWCGLTYKTKPSRASTSRFCSNACKLASMHEGNRKH